MTLSISDCLRSCRVRICSSSVPADIGDVEPLGIDLSPCHLLQDETVEVVVLHLPGNLHLLFADEGQQQLSTLVAEESELSAFSLASFIPIGAHCTMSVDMTGVATVQEAFVRSIVRAGSTAASSQVTAVP